MTVSYRSLEAKYKSLENYAKFVKFIQMLLGDFEPSELPRILFEDNTGYIFLAQNPQESN